MNDIPIFIPVKLNGKTRLSPYLSKEERYKLIICMLEDILYSIKNISKKIYIISNREIHVRDAIILKEDSLGLRNVLKIINEQASGESIFLPVDVPLIDGKDIENVLKIRKDYDYILSPARRNGISLVYRKSNKYDIMFTNKSFIDTLEYCKKNKIKYFIYFSRNLYLDIDTIEDIYEFLHLCKGRKKTYEYLNSIIKR